MVSAHSAKPLLHVPVLIVEDNAINAKVLRVLLELHGCDVRTAASGEAALELLADGAWRPKLVLVDLVLPRMSGVVLAGKLKAIPALASVPIIAVSSLNGPGTERVALQAGCTAYFRKPIDVDSFVAQVAKHVDRFSAETLP